MRKINEINPIGKPNNIPSTLSNDPPWPGKKDPQSLIFAFLFNRENNKSPNWQLIDVIIAIIKNVKEKKFVKKNNKDEIIRQLNITEPKAPE